MYDEEIIQAVRTNKPTTKEIEDGKQIIKKLIKTCGIKEIKIKDESVEDIELIY